MKSTFHLILAGAALFTANLFAEEITETTVDAVAEKSVETVESADEEVTTKPTVEAQELSPKEILARADAARGNLGGVRWTVEISEGEGEKTKNRLIDVQARGFDMLAETLAPAKRKGDKLLQVQNNMWFHTPGLSKPQIISKRSKLSGQADNGDIASTNYAENYEIVDMREEDWNGTPSYRFELKAVSKNVTYHGVHYWISKDRLVGIYAEYFAKTGKKLKVAEMSYDNSVEIDGAQQLFISEMRIKDSLKADRVTTLSFSDPEFKEISPRIFNVQALARR